MSLVLIPILAISLVGAALFLDRPQIWRQ